ncbi:MAG: magnesium chelatase [Rhodothermales bacterium]
MNSDTLTSITTLGALKASGYRSRSVKDELRANLIGYLQRREPVFTGIIGYDQTVIPQIQNAILGRHDIILLGLRGQAKSRLIRALPRLLDEYIPAIAGTELNDDPLAPLSKRARTLVRRAWRRHAHPLAPPLRALWREARHADTTIADLVGDIDPIKAVQQNLTYADEEVIHFGIIPRTNRGIFAINELPDLQPRIQVGLLNILEEQDIQIRGFNVRFPLDIMMVFSANPEDYTNRGNLITPLKDRIDSQIITHYPRTIETGIEITQQEAWQQRGDDSPTVNVPYFFREIIEQIAFEARESEYVDQKSGVSVRMTRAALEDLISAAERRALVNSEAQTTARISDLIAVEPAVTGKVELVYEGEQEGAQNVARLLIGRAVKSIFVRYFPDPADKEKGRVPYQAITRWFSKGNTLDLDPSMDGKAYQKAIHQVDGLEALVRSHTNPSTDAEVLPMMEFVLEALHQHSLIGKDLLHGTTSYSDMMGSMLSSLGSFDFDDDEDDDNYDRYR